MHKKIAVLGLWHLGCTVAASLAKSGFEVTALDSETEKLVLGELPIFEPGLTEMWKKELENGQLKVSSNYKEISSAEYILITADTPVDDKDEVDVDPIIHIFDNALAQAKRKAVIVVMSQVPVGTCRRLQKRADKRKLGIEVVYVPENLRLGKGIETFMNADRFVVGVSNDEARRSMKKFFEFYSGPIIWMSTASAEMVKHGINSFLAMSISFGNELSNIGEKMGADMRDVVAGIRSDTRIGKSARLLPGLGFAGGTLGRDVKVLSGLAKEFRTEAVLIPSIYRANMLRKQYVLKRIVQILGGVKGRTITLFGLVYKPGTNTLRRSWALELAKKLIALGAKVNGFDPALNLSDPIPKYVTFFEKPDAACSKSDLVIITTEWPEFKDFDYSKVMREMRRKRLYDPNNFLELHKLTKIESYGTGR